MKLTEAERLILWNQYETRKHLDPTNIAHHQAVQEVLRRGYQPLYASVLTRMENETLTENQVQFVHEVMSMYYSFYDEFENSGSINYLSRFLGFSDPLLIEFISFSVNNLGQWKMLDIRQFDARFPIEATYKRMLEVWRNKMRLRPTSQMTKDDQAEVIAAGRSVEREEG